MNTSIVLVVDIGNSHTVVGLYRGEKIAEYWRLTSNLQTTSDEIFLRISGLVSASPVSAHNIEAVGLASVVPELQRMWVKALQKLTRLYVHVVSDKNCLETPIRYDHPDTLGPDRICNVIALKQMGYASAVAIDLGTATTFDVLHQGSFWGGCIVAGMSSSLEILTQKAARLVAVNLDWTENVIAVNSEDALRSGILYGFLGQLEYIVRQIQKELGVEKIAVIATGGWSSVLRGKTDVITEFDPYLTLKGIRAVTLMAHPE